MASPTDRRLAGLDVLRGGAAHYVAAYHCVGFLTPSGLRFDSRGGSVGLLLDGNPLGVLGFGLYAVLAFFVLSGFVVHLRLARQPEEPARRGAVAWAASYGWRRVVRIYPPLLGAIALTAGLAAAGSRLFDDWPWASGTLTDARNVLLPVFGATGFGNDLPLWSIAYELWFYAAYVPVVLVVLRLLRMPMPIGMGVVLGETLLLAVALVLVQDHAPQLLPGPARELAGIAVYLPAWVAGAFLAELHATGCTLRRRGLVLAAAAVLVLLAAPHSGNDLRPGVDLLWGLAACLVVAALTLGPREDRHPSGAARWAAGTARWSYSLYLVHVPVILFAGAAVGDGTGRTGSPLAVLASFGAALAVAWLFAQALEGPTRRRAAGVRPVKAV